MIRFVDWTFNALFEGITQVFGVSGHLITYSVTFGENQLLFTMNNGIDVHTQPKKATFIANNGTNVHNQSPIYWTHYFTV